MLEADLGPRPRARIRAAQLATDLAARFGLFLGLFLCALPKNACMDILCDSPRYEYGAYA